MATTPNDLISQVRNELDEAGVEGVWVNAEMVDWVNDGILEVAIKLRSDREEWFTRRIQSTGAAETILGATYTPTSSIDIVDGTDRYTLPADCLEIRSLEVTTQSDKDAGIVFLPRDMTNVEYMAAARQTKSSSRRIYYYATIGLTTLRIVPMPAATIHIELHYIAAVPIYTQFDSITVLSAWTFRAVKSYMKYRAYDKIAHPDTNSSLQRFQRDLNNVGSYGIIRQSQEPIIVEGFFDGDDVVNIVDVDPL